MHPNPNNDLLLPRIDEATNAKMLRWRRGSQGGILFSTKDIKPSEFMQLEGIWLVFWDTNYGVLKNEVLCVCKGKLEDVLAYAVNVPGFFYSDVAIGGAIVLASITEIGPTSWVEMAKKCEKAEKAKAIRLEIDRLNYELNNLLES